MWSTSETGTFLVFIISHPRDLKKKKKKKRLSDVLAWDKDQLGPFGTFPFALVSYCSFA